MSSSSSLLEPAEIDSIPETGHIIHERRALNRNHEQAISSLDALPQSEEFEKGSVATPVEPINLYQKRLRHRTREDKYSLKENGRAKKQVEDGSGKKSRKRKRREKLGKTVMHDFTASNVTQDRLTMRPAASLGLFRQGRASSPIRRRGLPDLAFSERAFLRSHKQDSHVPNEGPAVTRKRRKKGKAADSDAEISRYFTSKALRACKEPVDAGVDKKQVQMLASPACQYQMRSGSCQMSLKSSPPPVDLPDRPYLGFGSSGASLSPVKLTHDLDELPLIPERPLSEDDSNSNSTGYYTWSQSSVLSCSPVKRGPNALTPGEDQEVLETALQQKRWNEQSKDSAVNATLKPRNRMDCGISVQEEHFERPFSHRKRSRDAQSSSNTNGPPQLPTHGSIKGSTQIIDVSDMSNEFGKKALKAATVAEVNQPNSTQIERSPCPASAPLVHHDAMVSSDAALDKPPRACEANPLESSKPITASEHQALSFRSRASQHPDVRKPARANQESGASLTSHEDETGEGRNSHYHAQSQDGCDCNSALTARPSPKRLCLGFQDGEREVKSSASGTAPSYVLESETCHRDSARHPQASRFDRHQQRLGYSGGAWNAYESMYENQKIKGCWHDSAFDDKERRSNAEACEPKLEIEPSIEHETYVSPEDLYDKQRLSYQPGMIEQPTSVAELNRQLHGIPQDRGPDLETFDGHLPTYTSETFPLYHNKADIGFF
ncbi:MAG: hypothetical protein Q9191_001407 [Dirinaria sp. TL-2023a]